MSEEEFPVKTFYCSFCGKSQHEVKKLIAGPNAFICDFCTILSMDILIVEGAHTEGTLKVILDAEEYLSSQYFPHTSPQQNKRGEIVRRLKQLKHKILTTQAIEEDDYKGADHE